MSTIESSIIIYHNYHRLGRKARRSWPSLPGKLLTHCMMDTCSAPHIHIPDLRCSKERNDRFWHPI